MHNITMKMKKDVNQFTVVNATEKLIESRLEMRSRMNTDEELQEISVWWRDESKRRQQWPK